MAEEQGTPRHRVCRRLDRCERRLRHGGNPVARWMLAHLVVRRDPAGNIKPDKERSADKIDAHVAAVMALDRATRHVPARRSAYEDHGVPVV